MQLTQISPTDRFGTIAMIARWRPVHLGHTPVLRALCDRSNRAIIGIGSANRYNLRNPFSLAETTDMLKLALAGYDNYELLPIDDLDDGPRWREMVKAILDPLAPIDLFVTANPYVAKLLHADYPICRPVSLIADEDKIPIDGTMVRHAMAAGGDWETMVPDVITDYIKTNKLDQRFRREFGLEALAMRAIERR
ncbi:MAG: nicotinamide-nucleotide adenylyltransferase [Cellvibrionaceae bacterium]|jgi:nicotinamide-nucleotide adenylyltransferase